MYPSHTEISTCFLPLLCMLWEAWIKRSVLELWPGTLCCVLGQDTLPSQCLSPSRCINGYSEFNVGGQPCNGLASHPGGSRIHASETGDKRRPDGTLGSYADFACTLPLQCTCKVWLSLQNLEVTIQDRPSSEEGQVQRGIQEEGNDDNPVSPENEVQADITPWWKFQCTHFYLHALSPYFYYLGLSYIIHCISTHVI